MQGNQEQMRFIKCTTLSGVLESGSPWEWGLPPSDSLLRSRDSVPPHMKQTLAYRAVSGGRMLAQNLAC